MQALKRKAGDGGMSFAAAVVIFFTIWWALSTVLQGKSDKDYPAFKFLSDTLGKEESGLKRLFKPLFVITANIMDDSKKLAVKEQLKMAGMDSTPEELLAAQVVLGLGGVLVTITVGRIVNNSTLMALSPMVGIFMFMQPKSTMKNKIKEKKNAIRNELPDFIDTLILLTEAGFTPYQAIKQAVSYAGGALGQEVKEMTVEMEALSDEVGAMKKFSDRMQIPELRNFVASMIQASTTDSAKAREIYAQQALFMREMRVSNVRRLIKELPGRVKGFNFVLFLVGMAIPVIPLVLMFTGMKLSF